MTSVNFESSSNHGHPEIESDGYQSFEIKDNRVQTNPVFIDCKTENCTNLEGMSSVSGVGLEQEKRVRDVDAEFVVFYKDLDKYYVLVRHGVICLNSLSAL